MEKIYTVEEIKEIFKRVELEVLEKLSNDMEEAEKNTGKKVNGMGKVVYHLNNIMVTTLLEQKLFEKLK